MKTHLRKFITLILTVSLIFGSAVSLTSCSYAAGFLGDVLDNIGNGANQDTENGEDENLTAQRNALLSSVEVVATIEIETGDSYYPGISNTEPRTMAGSGVIYKLDKTTGDAYIITNYHVVYHNKGVGEKISNDIKVYLYGLVADSYAIEAEYVGGSFNYDIAVLKVTDSELLRDTPVTAATLGDSELLRMLDPVIAIGNAEGEGFSATRGGVSVPSEYLTMKGPDKLTDITIRVIRVDAPINEGNSGGGLFNAEGSLVGIVNAKKIGEKIDNIAYAIPINLAVAVAENIVYHSTSESSGLCKYLLGVTITEGDLSIDVDNSGEVVRTARVTVSDVTATSPVRSSVKAGDCILEISINGQATAVTALHHVTETMLDARPGDTVTLLIERGNSTHTATVTVTAEMGVIQ